MSDTPTDFNLREQIARIDKLQAETQKLRVEQQKMLSERLKFNAEAEKLGWDVRFALYLVIAAVIGGLLGVATFIAHLMGH